MNDGLGFPRLSWTIQRLWIIMNNKHGNIIFHYPERDDDKLHWKTFMLDRSDSFMSSSLFNDS